MRLYADNLAETYGDLEDLGRGTTLEEDLFKLVEEGFPDMPYRHKPDCSCSYEVEVQLADIAVTVDYPKLVAVDNPPVDGIPFLWQFTKSEGSATWLCVEASRKLLAMRRVIIHEDPV